MQEYTYSITISHYNNISLLKRMLKSIPERDDIQIIVVDDYSTFENKEKLTEVKRRYDMIADNGKMVRIDGTQSEKNVLEDILKALNLK